MSSTVAPCPSPPSAEQLALLADLQEQLDLTFAIFHVHDGRVLSNDVVVAEPDGVVCNVILAVAAERQPRFAEFAAVQHLVLSLPGVEPTVVVASARIGRPLGR